MLTFFIFIYIDIKLVDLVATLISNAQIITMGHSIFLTAQIEAHKILRKNVVYKSKNIIWFTCWNLVLSIESGKRL